MGPPASYGQYEEFSGGYGDVGPTKIFMRGLPFRVTCRQVEEFFQPLPCADVKFGVLPDGRASGDGIVEFRTPDEAHQALQRDRGTISNRCAFGSTMPIIRTVFSVTLNCSPPIRCVCRLMSPTTQR